MSCRDPHAQALPAEAMPVGGFVGPVSVLAKEAGGQASVGLGTGLEFFRLSGNGWDVGGNRTGWEAVGSCEVRWASRGDGLG